MGRILPFYRTGGVVSGGGGGGGNTGVPLGPFNDWSELPASAAGGSLAAVLTLGPASSSGLAIYDTGDAEWKLQFGTFETLADLLTFTDPINSLALATVGTLLDDPESVRYQWDDTVPEWVRTPDPVHYLYPQATDWADLPAEDTVQNMDEAKVGDLGYMHSSGIAERHGNAWELLQGKFQNVADMNDFDDTVADVRPDAIALVKSGGGHDEEAIAYSYQGGNWVRFGATTTAGYAWTLSSLRDFSAIALQDGDFGYYGNTLYRYAAAVSVTGGGTTPMWLPPAVYAGTPTVRAQLVGTEAIGALPVTVNGVTFAVVSSPPITSTVTQASDYIQFQAFTGTGNIIHGTALYTMGSTVRNYMQVEISVTYTNTSGAITRIFASEGSGQPAWYFHLGPSGSISPLPYFAAGTVLQGSQEAIRDGGIAFPSNASGNYTMTEFVDSGRNVAAECFMNGISYARSRRSSTTTGFVNPGAGVGFYMQANSFGPGGTMTTRIRNWRILTW
jgi:hypothetical protein